MSHSPWWRRPSPEQEGDEPATPAKTDQPPTRSRIGSSRASTKPASRSDRKRPASDAAPSHGVAPSADPAPRRRRGKRPARDDRESKSEAGNEQRPPTPTSGRATLAVRSTAAGHTAVLCDVESVATVLREAGLELEDAPAALARVAGEAGVRRVYALGNRFSRLRRVLEDAGYERVGVEGSPASLRLQMAVDAVDLSHGDPSASFLLAASGDDIQPLLDRLAGEGRTVALFAPEGLAGLPTEARRAARREEPEDDDEEGGMPEAPARRSAAATAPVDEDREDEELYDADDADDAEAATADEVEDFDEDDDFDFDGDRYQDEDGHEDEDEEPYDEAPRTSAPSRSPQRAPARSAARRGPPERPASVRSTPAAQNRHREMDDPFDLLLGALERIVQGPPRLVFESIVRQEILEMEPDFNEREAGFGSFTEFFEEAQERGLIELRREPATGTYLVVGAHLVG